MRIKPTKSAKNLQDIDHDLYLELDMLLYPVDGDVPCPWDAIVEIKGGDVVISGSLEPGGVSGRCECTVPIDKFSDYYYIEIEDNDEYIEKLTSNGWVKA